MGHVISAATTEGFPPKPKWGVGDIPDLTGKVIIVTGGAAGIGKETSKALLNHNAKVYIAARNETLVRKAIEELKSETDKEALFIKLDLADLKSVRAAAQEFQSKEPELHVLFNNAGVMVPPIEAVTAQGYDLQFGTNVLGHFYFTKLLMPQLIAGSKTSGDGKARIVTTSSSASVLVRSINFNTIIDTPARKKRSNWMLYGESKLGSIVLANELAARYGDQGIVSTSMNPGNLNSELQRHLKGLEGFLVSKFLYPVPMGALAQLYAGTSPEGVNFNGKYLIPWGRIGKNHPFGQNVAARRKVWDWLEEQVAKFEASS
ncbi:Short-chain dehydrogenase [Psilocybe cubensis]|uniref:NAD(P)-binding protein n=2 Tax=Psilocybe cubensis TaxID=181762 RepID=A0A8H7XP68_PSICU|nr:Short-chain dehydrogenase [Psilocybe cubensis]KAH9480656.1 Short-chain dehydrogenase [Psilocybe cubensis]